MTDQALTSASHAPAGHLGMMDGARAIAAFMVLLTHAGSVSGATSGSWLGPFLARGDWGVALFFVLSGFLLTRPWVAWRSSPRPRPSAATYARKRGVRILPGYWLALLAVVLLLPVPADPGAVVSNALLTQIYTLDLLPGFFQTWSLCTEIAFYAVLPLLAPLVVRRSRRRSLLLIGLLACISPLWIMACKEWFSDQMHPYAVIWLPGHIDWFCAGMALAVLERQMRTGLRTAPLVGPYRWLLVGCLSFALSLTALGGPLGFTPISGPNAIAKEMLYGISALCLVGAMLQPGAGATLWGRALDSRAMTWAGVISYGFFLWHVLVLDQVRHWLGLPENGGGFLMSLILTVLITLAVSHASYILMERPLMRRFGGSTPGKKPRATMADHDGENGNDEAIQTAPQAR